MSPHPVRMKVHVLWKMLYVLELVAILALTAINVLAGNLLLGLVFTAATAFTLYVLLLSFTTIEANAEGLVVVRPPYGTYKMRWDEASRAETTGRAWVLRGDGRSLGFNTLMGDGQAKALRAYTEEQLQGRGIPIQRAKALSKINAREFNNTRVRS